VWPQVRRRRRNKGLLVPCLPLRFSRDDKSAYASAPKGTHFVLNRTAVGQALQCRMWWMVRWGKALSLLLRLEVAEKPCRQHLILRKAGGLSRRMGPARVRLPHILRDGPCGSPQDEGVGEARPRRSASTERAIATDVIPDLIRDPFHGAIRVAFPCREQSHWIAGSSPAMTDVVDGALGEIAFTVAQTGRGRQTLRTRCPVSVMPWRDHGIHAVPLAPREGVNRQSNTSS